MALHAIIGSLLPETVKTNFNFSNEGPSSSPTSAHAWQC